MKKRRSHKRWRGTDLIVFYDGRQGGIDGAKDRSIRAALGKYETGSGFAFPELVRDHTATVPLSDLERVLARLKKIRGIKTKKCVVTWVLCR